MGWKQSPLVLTISCLAFVAQCLSFVLHVEMSIKGNICLCIKDKRIYCIILCTKLMHWIELSLGQISWGEWTPLSTVVNAFPILASLLSIMMLFNAWRYSLLNSTLVEQVNVPLKMSTFYPRSSSFPIFSHSVSYRNVNVTITINISLLQVLFSFVMLLRYDFFSQKGGLVAEIRHIYPCGLVWIELDF